MSCFTTMSAVTAGGELDLTKHVNYTAGMILGVDDFTQEFAYLSGRDRWLARDTIGYGTVSGLSVRIDEDADKGPRVMVSAGVGINPRGQLICVPAPQCAYLNQWLAAAKSEDLADRIAVESGSPPAGDHLTLYVVLCYRDCPTDDVPIPGEPCRNDEELTVASRIKDDFSLELRFEPPKQREEDAVRKYVAWLRSIEVTETGSSTAPEDFVQAIRDQWLPVTTPPITSPPITSPPTSLQINIDDVCEYMRLAFRVWVTELRELLSGREAGCGVEMTGGGNLENCILLAELDIPLVAISPGWQVSDFSDIGIDEDDRPFLLHLRMLQEWMLCGCNCPAAAGSVITSPPTVVHDHSLDSLTDVTVVAPSDGQVLTFDGTGWIARTPTGPGGGTTDHGALVGLNDDDHTQYLLTNGGRALTGNLLGGGRRIVNLAAGQAAGEAVIFQQAVKQADAAGGDLGGTYPNPSVTQIQGRKISNQNPNSGDALVWNGSAWIPQRQEVPASDPFLILPLATVTRRDNNLYELWFNLDAPGNLAEIKAVSRDNLRIFDETDNPATFLEEIRYSASRTIRNVFTLKLAVSTNQREPDFMRFNFNVEKTIVAFKNDELPLGDYSRKNNIKFTGYLNGETATVFVRGSGQIG